MLDNKRVVLPTFSGKDEDFQVWWTKFCAFATAKGLYDALAGRETNLPPAQFTGLDKKDASNKKKIKARERNSLAMAYLLSAFKAQADISMAYEAMEDPDWPGDLAYKVVKQLLKTYQPDNNVTKIKLYAKLLAEK